MLTFSLTPISQAKDAFGNNRLEGGDDVSAMVTSAVTYRGAVVDNEDGTYKVIYTVPRAGYISMFYPALKAVNRIRESNP